MSAITIKIFPDSRSLSIFAAELFSQLTHAAVEQRGKFLTALSGGSTPVALYRLLAQAPYRAGLPWDQQYFFWGDERCVPADDAESCYHQAYLALLGQVPVPVENIFRVKGELGPLPAAEDYARLLKTIAEPGKIWPRFDLVLLGLGADGHTASLFPDSVETSGVATVAVSANYQDRPAQRVSLTPDVINAARNVVFLAAGAEKAQALSATVTGRREPFRLPAQRIHPDEGRLWWLVDEAAASLLPDSIAGLELQR